MFLCSTKPLKIFLKHILFNTSENDSANSYQNHQLTVVLCQKTKHMYDSLEFCPFQVAFQQSVEHVGIYITVDWHFGFSVKNDSNLLVLANSMIAFLLPYSIIEKFDYINNIYTLYHTNQTKFNSLIFLDILVAIIVIFECYLIDFSFRVSNSCM